MKFIGRIIILLFCSSLLIPFQNCSVYKSEGRKAFESSLAEAENKGCYPYIDTNLAMDFIGAVDGSLNVYKNKAEDEDAYICDFRAANHLLNHINCKVSQGNGEYAIILKQDGANAFDGIVSTWTAPVRTGFSGTTFGGYITLDTDGIYTIKFLALENSETKGVGCAVRLIPEDYNENGPEVRNALSKITFEMAIQNIE